MSVFRSNPKEQYQNGSVAQDMPVPPLLHCFFMMAMLRDQLPSMSSVLLLSSFYLVLLPFLTTDFISGQSFEMKLDHFSVCAQVLFYNKYRYSIMIISNT